MTKYFTLSRKSNITIPFDELTGQDVGYLNSFHLHRKRTYCNLSETIVKYCNIIAEQDTDGELFFKYLAEKVQISKNENYSVEEFKNRLYTNIVNNESLLNIIDNFVEENYCMNLDESSKLKKQKNESLIYTDRHCKIILKISTMQKFIIPLVVEYLHQNFHKIITNDYKVDCFLLDMFEPLFEEDYFRKGYKINIRHKLYESVKSRVHATRCSDKTIWSHYEYNGENENTYSEILAKKLLTDIIPKATVGEGDNIVTLIHIVVKMSLENLFRNKLPFNYKTFEVVKDSSNNHSTFDKIEINNAKINESEIVINKNNLVLTTKQICRNLNFKVEREELEFYIKNTK